MRWIGSWQRIVVLGVLCTLCGAAGAQSTQAVDGEWFVKLGIHTLFVLTLKPGEGNGHAVSGSMARPKHLQTQNMTSFSEVEGPTVVGPIVASEWKGNSLSITLQNPADATDKDTWIFRVKDATHAELQLVGPPFQPLSFVRAEGAVAVSTDWEPGRTYSNEDGAASNPEMKKIFDEDQSVRAAGPFKIDWSVVGKADAARREATRKLLEDGTLHSGEDFTWASFVFQHGDTANDYLLAHTLAMVAVRKGYSNAIWIAAATLDRYLQMMKQPQIYGTQFNTPKDAQTTQEPYDRALISDALRRQLDVPPLAGLAEQSKQYDAESKRAK